MWPFSHKSQPVRVRHTVSAKFDAAQTTAENRNHWANADNLSPNAAASPAVRQVIRNRARYEVANNSYARGMLLTLANDVIGTGPRLQLLTSDSKLNQAVERAFAEWSKTVNLASKLRTMRMAVAQDGEAFAMMVTNPGTGSPIGLDIELIEADRITSPQTQRLFSDQMDPADGIEVDAYGNPQSYHLLRQHPGSNASVVVPDYLQVAAAAMLHLFRSDRPGQRRGLPEIMPALPLFAQLRRYTLAVVAAAETAANMAVLMETPAPAGGEAADVDAGVEMELTRNQALFMPEGWTATQLKAEQPTTTYAMFKAEILNEIARCLNMPFNVAAGNSSAYNYASGRLDHQTYYKSIRVDQTQIESTVLDRVFAAWLNEAALVLNFNPKIMVASPHQWFWDGTEHVDPAKEATAQAQRLASHTTTLAAEYARQGKDWETEIQQCGKEAQLLTQLGLTPPAMQPTQPDDPEEPANERKQQQT